MNNFEDIQKLWQQNVTVSVPSAEETIRNIRRQQNREKLVMIGSTVALAATFFYILFIAFHYHFTYASTYTGILLVLLSVLAAVFVNSRMISLLLRNDATTDIDNKTMLNNLERYQERQAFFQTTFLSSYYLLLTAGLMLYMYEITERSLTFMLIAYTLSLGWIAFAWWYIRPRTIRKQRERMRAILDNIKSLQNDMNE